MYILAKLSEIVPVQMARWNISISHFNPLPPPSASRPAPPYVLFHTLGSRLPLIKWEVPCSGETRPMERNRDLSSLALRADHKVLMYHVHLQKRVIKLVAYQIGHIGMSSSINENKWNKR